MMTDIFRGAQPHNSLLVGDYGTGKTLVARSVTEELEKDGAESGIKIKSIYINCSDNDTHTQILRGILNQIDGQKGRTGFPTDQYQLWFQKFASNLDYVFLTLDEFDKAVFRRDSDYEKLLYFLTRTVSNVVTIMLTNKLGLDKYLRANLDSRIRDTHRYQIISFPDYVVGELRDILKIRCEIGLYQTAYDIHTISKIADVCFKNGLRARGLIDLTRTAGELAERDNAHFLEDHFIDEATEMLIDSQSLQIIENLDPLSRAILYFVLEAESINSEYLYENYSYAARQLGTGSSKSSFYTHLKRLFDLDLLTAEKKGRGRGKGVNQIIQLHPSTAEDVRRFFDKLKEMPPTPPLRM